MPARIDVELKNFRCFTETAPARFAIQPGVTAVVGTNNSGKSTLLRMFYELRPLFESLAQNPALFYVDPSTLQQAPTTPVLGVFSADEIFSDTNEHDIVIDLTPAVEPRHDGIEWHTGKLRIEVSRNPEPTPGFRLPPQPHIAAKAMLIPHPAIPVGPHGRHMHNGTILTPASGGPIDVQNYVDALSVLGDSLYMGAFRTAPHIPFPSQQGTPSPVISQTVYDVDIGQRFVERWHAFTSGDRRSLRRANDLNKVLANLFGFTSLEIRTTPSNDTFLIYADGGTYRLHEMGSGVGQVITVLAHAAMSDRSLVLIDEPELNLHPSLQVAFLRAVERYAKVAVVFSTQSVPLARSAADRIYSVTRKSQGSSVLATYEETKELTAWIEELRFVSERELGFDGVLLVEGGSDLPTVRQLLRLYGVDQQYLVLLLGGSTLINASRAPAELVELKGRLTENVYALIDSERVSEAAPVNDSVRGFADACKDAGVTCLVTQRRAIENYFPEHAVQSVKGPKYRALEQYEKLKEVTPAWGKPENVLIAREMTQADLEGTDLGEFLTSLVKGDA